MTIHRSLLKCTVSWITLVADGGVLLNQQVAPVAAAWQQLQVQGRWLECVRVGLQQCRWDAKCLCVELGCKMSVCESNAGGMHNVCV